MRWMSYSGDMRRAQRVSNLPSGDNRSVLRHDPIRRPWISGSRSRTHAPRRTQADANIELPDHLDTAGHSRIGRADAQLAPPLGRQRPLRASA
jgi:hypothetical protein